MYFSEFERPTEEYNEKVKEIDEKICSLIQERNEISNGDPGFPPTAYIQEWSKKYHLYEDFIHGLFGHLHAEEMFQPRVEPKEFKRNIPILQSVELDDLFFTLTYVRQYENASVLNLIVDLEGAEVDPSKPHDQPFFHQIFDLIVVDNRGTKYNAVTHGGSGMESHMALQYVISPPLPTDSSPINLTFKMEKKSQPIQFTIHLS